MSGDPRDRAWDQLTPQEQAGVNRFASLIEEEKKRSTPAPEDPLAVQGGKTIEERQREGDSRYHGTTVDDPLAGLE